MERSVEQLFSEAVIREAEHRFDLDKNKSKKIGDFENYVFQVNRNDEPLILRLTHSSHRTEDQVVAELKWINYLSEHGVSVSSALFSKSGKLVEQIDVEDSSFYASLFQKAPGNPIDINEKGFNTELFSIWGQTIGKMHAVTKNYQLIANEPKRSEWFEDDLLDYKKIIPASQTQVIQKADKLLDESYQLPKDKKVYLNRREDSLFKRRKSLRGR
jgi:Ser/Thr protein kinase RdoA (MazF antagonist)